MSCPTITQSTFCHNNNNNTNSTNSTNSTVCHCHNKTPMYKRLAQRITGPKADPRTTAISSDVILAILAKFVPPIPVYIKRGVSADLAINVALTVLGGFPGIVHAWYLILKNPEEVETKDKKEEDGKAETVTEEVTEAVTEKPIETPEYEPPVIVDEKQALKEQEELEESQKDK